MASLNVIVPSEFLPILPKGPVDYAKITPLLAFLGAVEGESFETKVLPGMGGDIHAYILYSCPTDDDDISVWLEICTLKADGSYKKWCEDLGAVIRDGEEPCFCEYKDLVLTICKAHYWGILAKLYPTADDDGELDDVDVPAWYHELL
jgi:hypothetical protein